MYTEDEAKQKDCCLSMGASSTTRCVGMSCMAWRWGPLVKLQSKRPDKKIEDVRVGYCGMASQPMNYE